MECTTLWGCVVIEVERPSPSQANRVHRSGCVRARWREGVGHHALPRTKEKGPRSLRTEGLAA